MSYTKNQEPFILSADRKSVISPDKCQITLQFLINLTLVRWRKTLPVSRKMGPRVRHKHRQGDFWRGNMNWNCVFNLDFHYSSDSFASSHDFGQKEPTPATPTQSSVFYATDDILSEQDVTSVRQFSLFLLDQQQFNQKMKKELIYFVSKFGLSTFL